MRYILFLFSLLLANTASAIDCDVAPTCEELGYSKKDDPYCAENGYMYCPLDYSYKKCVNMDCAKLGFSESDKSSWCGKLIKCKGNPLMTLCQNLCEVGDVYYADGTCGYAQDYDGSKIPVGVVYWVTDDGRHGKVINLHDLGRESESSAFDPKNPYNTKYTYLYWGYSSYDVPDLMNYDENSNMVPKLRAYDPDLYDGQGNTDKILKAEKPKCDKPEGTKDYYQYCIPQAAQAAHDFYPLDELKEDSKVGHGKWYLPALGELMYLYGYDNSQITSYIESSGAKGDNMMLVNNTLSTLKSKDVVAEALTNNCYLPSSEYSQFLSWFLCMTNGSRTGHFKSLDSFVRVSLEF